MDEISLIHIRHALEDLNAAFVHYLDRNQIEPLINLFTLDAVYTHGERRSIGTESIRALFAGRARLGARTTRHLYSGLLLTIDSERTAHGSSVCTAFALDGSPPLRPAIPHLVADFCDDYILDSSGEWKFARRSIQRIFEGPTNTGPIGPDASAEVAMNKQPDVKPKNFTGGCLCGAIRYLVQGNPEFVMQCYCRDCQKATGTGHTTIVGVLDSNLAVSGSPATFTVSGESGGRVTRHFCGVCGGRLYTSGDLPGPIRMIQAGSLDDPNWVTPTAAVYVKDAIHWDVIHPDIKRYDRLYPLDQRPQDI